MDYLLQYGLTNIDIEEIKQNVTEDVYSELSLFANLVSKNISFLKDFGVTNYAQVVKKYPQIFLRDEESFQNVLTKFDKEDLIGKALKNPAVIKKMVDFVDNEQ